MHYANILAALAIEFITIQKEFLNKTPLHGEKKWEASPHRRLNAAPVQSLQACARHNDEAGLAGWRVSVPGSSSLSLLCYRPDLFMHNKDFFSFCHVIDSETDIFLFNWVKRSMESGSSQLIFDNFQVKLNPVRSVGSIQSEDWVLLLLLIVAQEITGASAEQDNPHSTQAGSKSERWAYAHFSEK